MPMSNPFSPLQDALKILCTEAEVLPATGQATVDLVMPDLEEIYDRQTGGMATVGNIWEVPSRTLYRAVKPIHRLDKHLLRYFVDGSALTYFIGTVLEQERSTPVQLSQVGAAMVYRHDDGNISVANANHSVLLTLEKKALSDDLWSKVEQTISRIKGFKLCDSATNNAYTDAMNLQEARPRGAHCANWHMRELEKILSKDVGRDQSDWLVIDGSLGNEYENWKSPPVIGVAKTFRRDSQFELGTGPRAKKLSLYGLLKDLGENQRTVVFSRKRKDGSNEGKILFWYVRIRPQKGLDYPLMGVIKAEMPNPSQQPVGSDLIDEISGCLIAERSVAPHGRDGRWHAHLYPIYIAERVIRGRFYSEEMLNTTVHQVKAR
ncbi:hypothetical protein KFU94_64570 [Chloroflexi bacterium TSY]|nr:hypothetical protein [Chloroflexi bacterium TSY]MBV7339026.1 hypothetical protein [Chloroflexi bacterium TSY]